jgi:Glycogen recognition site of AMP-activated protein kinase
MATFASSSRGSPAIDISFINELYEEIESNPPALEARKLLIQQCMDVGWVDAARDAIRNYLALDPYNEEVLSWEDILSEGNSTHPSSRDSPTSKNISLRAPPPSVPDNIEEAQLELLRGYEALRTKAAKLLRETYLVRGLAKQHENQVSVAEKKGKRMSFITVLRNQLFSVLPKKEEAPTSSRFEVHIQNLTAITDGRISSVVRIRQPGSAQSVARAMEKTPERAVDIAIGDLEDMARWLRSQSGHRDNDLVRKAPAQNIDTFVFRWEHAASEVYVTGTFDNWASREKLFQTGNVFEKRVTLPSASKKIYYKFVVDGSWVVDPTAPQESDASGNMNNVLTPDRIVKHTPETAGKSPAWPMMKNPKRAVSDTEDITQRHRSQSSYLDNDALREALVKRVDMLSSALSNGMKRNASLALMHVEHELLHRTYACDETMYGDKVADIPRARFLATEDGYPWDMEELAQAIQSNSGVMRNPLSRQMFTTEDIRMILQHPLGKGLAALGVEQGKLSKGVRPKTIEELEKMSVVLLADMSENQMESRHALDHFLGYVATLPESEQKALDKLRVPAKDSHTGQAFDTTIGEAVRDAKANVVCIHKIGDFLQQAARHLKRSK